MKQIAKMSQKASSQKLELLLADPLLVGAVLVFLRGHESAKGFAQTCLLFYRHLGDSSSQYTQAIWRQWIQQEFSKYAFIPGGIKCWKEVYTQFFKRHSLRCARWLHVEGGHGDPVSRQGSAGCSLPNGDFALYGGWTVEGLGHELHLLQREAETDGQSVKWVWREGIVPRFEARPTTYGNCFVEFGIFVYTQLSYVIHCNIVYVYCVFRRP